MKTTKEVLKTNLPAVQLIHCDSCEKSTGHKVVASHEARTVFENDDRLEIAMQIIRCETCETVSFRELYASRGFHEENSKGVWVDPVTERLYSRTEIATTRRLSADESTGIFD
ncbi:MAG: hypothetical protein Q7T66_04890 [Herminiimonas sp.]|uniref:hypothetical protein n=1 Tax=Herminiimonas sp. TaxID=1926289 RepID=UPI00271AA80A|nr:hypothetical protein [Herminiimonas sp.]MDO9419982.1 hypothetical protein [Herminiimonas sp.]